jgi:hypothetical protein
MERVKDIIRQQLFEAEKPKPEVRDLEGTKLDVGKRGKSFEATLLKAFDLVGLKYRTNRVTGGLWDVHPEGEGWERLVQNKDINIKVAGARWMFGAAEFTKILPWDEIKDLEAFDKDKAAAKVKKVIRRRGIHKALFLSPKTKDIEKQIDTAVQAKDVEALNKILIKKNFKLRKLGSKFEVRVSIKDNRIGSIAVDSGGKVFMRSERPRMVAGSKLVGFRAPRDALKRAKETKVKTEAVACGDCFRFAVQYPMKHSIEMFEKGVVVHGMVHNPDPGPGERNQFEHAWIEFKGKVYDWQMVEVYNMKPPSIKAFYAYWGPFDTKKYTPGKALGNSIKHGHFGPW